MSEREWREAADMRRSTVALLLIVAAGYALRLWNLGTGIPYAVGIDEPAIMTTVVRILKSGDFNPRFFEYPTGYIYVQLGTAIVRFLFGAMAHSWRAVQQVGPADFYLWGRFVTATIGAATIPLLYQAGMRWGARHALLAAGLMAVIPMHVRESHFALTDVPLTFCVVLTFLLSLRAAEKPTLAAFALAGAAAGLSAGMKYNGLMAVSMPLAVAFFAAQSRQAAIGRAGLAAAACVAVFFATTPYALIDLPAFLNGFGTQAAAFSPRQRTDEASWLVYLKHLRLTFGWPGSLLAAAGLGLTVSRIVRGPNRVRWVLLVLFPVIYFDLITGWTFLFARYAMPLLPFIVLWAAIATVSGVSLLRRFSIPRAVRTAAIIGLTIAALAPPAYRSIEWIRGYGVVTTQALAWKWISYAIWPDSTIVSELKGLDLPAERYRAETVKSVLERSHESLEAAGVQWIVLSSGAWPGRTAEEISKAAPPEAYRSYYATAQEVKVIVPSEANPGPEIHILRMGHRAP